MFNFLSSKLNSGFNLAVLLRLSNTIASFSEQKNWLECFSVDIKDSVLPFLFRNSEEVFLSNYMIIWTDIVYFSYNLTTIKLLSL